MATALSRPTKGSAATRGGAVPADLEGGDRCRQPSELDLAEGSELESAPGSDQIAHQRGGQDLAPLSQVAQATGHHHGQPEVVVLVADRIAHVEPDPHLHPSSRRTSDGPLHLDGTAHCVHCPGYHDHQPITQALDLVAASRRDLLPQHLEVDAAEAVELVVAELVEERGGAHKIGEQQCDDAVGHRTPPQRGRF